MGHPNSFTAGCGRVSSDGKFHFRYPGGNRFALLASVDIRKTPSGIIDSRYPDGDDRAAEIPLTWDTSSLPTLENLTTGGASFSVNVRAMLSEPGSPAATITVETLSGDNAAAEGWSISGNNLVNPLSDAGSGVLRLAAERSGVTVYSLPLVWSKQASAPADTLAPIIVTGLVAVPAVGQIALAWDASSDPHDGMTAGAMDEYDIKVGAAVVATIAAAAGISPKLTVSTIGTVSPAPSAIQTGASWAITVAGTGFFSAADSGVFVGAPVTGDGSVTLKLASMTIATPSAIGPQIRESLDPTAKLVHIHQSSNFAQVGARARARTSAGQSPTIIGEAAGVQPPNWLKVARVGDTFTTSYSLDGNAFTAVGVVTLSMPATVYMGFAAASGSADTTFDAAVQQVNVNNVARPTYTHTTGAGGTYTIVARDAALNAAAGSAPVIAVPLGSSLVRRWNPGIWLSLLGHAQSYWQSVIESTAPYAWNKGIALDYEWKQIEISSGVFDFSQVAADFQLAKNAGKKFHARIITRVFNSHDPSRRIVPLDIWNSPGRGQTFFANGGVAARIWEAPIMDRLIAAFRALYDEFDSDTAFDGASTDETSIGFSSQYPEPSGWSNEASLSQWQRLSACRMPGTKANLNILANYLGTDAQMEQLIQTARANKCGVGGPDTWKRSWVENHTPRAIQGDEIVRGERGSLHDYRPEIIVVSEVQGTSIGDYIANFTAAEVYDVAYNINRCNYFFVHYTREGSTPDGNSSNFWDTGFVPLFEGNGGVTNTTLPTGY